jgi:hypothetical protein
MPLGNGATVKIVIYRKNDNGKNNKRKGIAKSVTIKPAMNKPGSKVRAG